MSGLGSVIAYNWDAISDPVKLLGMGFLLAAAIGYTFRVQPKADAAFEVGALVVSGLCLAALGLVSQIYAQDGSLWQLLAFWCVLTAPLLLLTSSRFLSFYTFLALAITLVSGAEALHKFISNQLFRNGSEVAAALILFLATLLIALAFHRSSKPERRSAGTWLFGLHLIALGAVSGLAFLADDAVQPKVAIIGFLGLLAALPLLRGPATSDFGLGSFPIVASLLGLGLLEAIIPLAFVRSDSPVAAFIGFVAFFSVYFWAAERVHNTRGVRLAVGLLGLRVVVASFELFENLLVTGLVLMALGALALFFTRRRLGRAISP